MEFCGCKALDLNQGNEAPRGYAVPQSSGAPLYFPAWKEVVVVYPPVRVELRPDGEDGNVEGSVGLYNVGCSNLGSAVSWL